MSAYRLQPGAVFERHGTILGPGPDNAWTRASQATIDMLKIQVEQDERLPK
jgi:hypothetical protein